MVASRIAQTLARAVRPLTTSWPQRRCRLTARQRGSRAVDGRYMILPTMTALERVPGKVVAVHASYRSRAAERGTMPAWPSYFLKPASSLAASGDPVARPPGCELLAFEGEVAL